ncbi:uncharacterized protein A1O5_10093 [Cladophialophora psammophila CBS 110553]|uniref:Uncharacterized protein n=1 Tax=Cladophialophora psammophila CBS 110553 TaxID=1182543 RepID=W9WG65_9EURO|nr:uncharacterized protein A1O5_10093 [Cladophialophora psammophila CBS 110553]EXJ66898.1 hypothetical protein A1O5_10093 [Cladophialophora psammophila CBS 110553]
MCKSGPRFRMYQKLKVKESILFYDPPLEYNQDGTDKDPSKIINNPGSLTQIDNDEQRKLCTDPLTRPLQPCDKCATFPLPGVSCDGRITKRYHRRTQGKRTHDPVAPHSNHTSASNTTSTPPKGTTNTNGTSSWKFEGILIISSIRVHSASKLCASVNSYGPSFIAISEGKFCDMKHKQLWDLCSSQKSTCCFDVDWKLLRPCAGHKIDARSVTKYKKVQYW